MNWIPCSERLPKEGQTVLITVNNKKRIVHEAIYNGKNKLNHAVWHSPWEYDFRTYWGEEILAWMPLPEPYQGGQE